MKKKYTSEEERKAAILESKRQWRLRNSKRIKEYNQDYYIRNREKVSASRGHTPMVIPDKPDLAWLVALGNKLLKDLETASQAKIAAKYNTNRRTLMRAVAKIKGKSDA